MRRTLIAFSICVVAVPAIAAKSKSLHIPSDPKAKYTVVDVRKSGQNKVVIVTKRVGPSGASYAKRLVDCDAFKFKYLGTSDTLDGLKKSKADRKMSRLINGSISYHVSKHACDVVKR